MAKPKTRSRWKPLGAFAIAAIFISAVAVNFRIHDMERAGLTTLFGARSQANLLDCRVESLTTRSQALLAGRPSF